MSILKMLVSAATVALLTFVPATASAWGPERHKTLTPVTSDVMVEALRESHVQQFGRRPSRNRLAMAWAQVSLENGRGRQVWNNNLGNIGPARTSNDAWYYHSPKVRYRDFGDLHDAGRAYWRVIFRCGSAMSAFDSGTPQQAAEGLKRCGYFMADLGRYVYGLRNLYYEGIVGVVPAAEHRENKRREEQHEERERIELEIRIPYTPTCGCSFWP